MPSNEILQEYLREAADEFRYQAKLAHRKKGFRYSDVDWKCVAAELSSVDCDQRAIQMMLEVAADQYLGTIGNSSSIRITPLQEAKRWATVARAADQLTKELGATCVYA